MDESTVAHYRRETPGLSEQIHLNNAGAALPPKQVVSAMIEYLEEEALLGGYETAALHAETLAGFHHAVGALIGTKSSNIAWANSATDAYSRALSSIPFRKGDLILTTENDYVSNQIAFLQLCRDKELELLRVPESEAGGLDLEKTLDLIQGRRPRLVAITHMPTSSGLIQEIQGIGALCQEIEGCFYLVDACQTAGQLALDINEIQCDFLSATFRKFLRGPRGAGFLFVSDRILETGLTPFFTDLHSSEWISNDDFKPKEDARRFELWERSYALVRGATEAALYAQNVQLPEIEARVRRLAREMRKGLEEIPGIRVLDTGRNLGGIVSLHISGINNPDRLVGYLRELGLNGSLTTISSARLDFNRKKEEWAYRLSPHYYNTEGEIFRAIEILDRIRIA